MKSKHPLCSLLALLSAFSVQPSAFGQGTAFTYQGRLADNGSPASGQYDLVFGVFSGATGLNLVSPLVTNSATTVADGLFTVTLDFGPGVFNGHPRWLGMSVRTNGAGTFTLLSPRQAIAATPYALLASNISGVLPMTQLPAAVVTNGARGLTLTGTFTGSGSGLSNVVQVAANGLVGLGTGTNPPAAGLQIATGPTSYDPNLLAQITRAGGKNPYWDSVTDVAVSGNLLATVGSSYFAGGEVVSLFNINQPASPNFLSDFTDTTNGGTFPFLGGANSVAFNGSVLAVAASVGNAVTLVSVTNPAAPVQVGLVRNGVGGFDYLLGAWDVCFSTNNLMAIAAYLDDAVTLADVSNPAAPVLRGFMRNGFNGFTNLNAPQEVLIHGTLLVVAAYGSSAVNLVDISNPADPQLLSVLKQGVGGVNSLVAPRALAISPNNLLAIAAEDTVTLVNIQSPASPQVLSVLRHDQNGYTGLWEPSGLAFGPNNVLAIAARYSGALTLVDVSNPAAPVMRGQFTQHSAGLHNLAGADCLVYSGNTLILGADDAVSLLRPQLREVNLAAADFVGIGTTLPAAPLHVLGNVLVDESELVSLQTQAFEAGDLVEASGEGSTALGQWTDSTGVAAIAAGRSSKASGDYSVAMGYDTWAAGLGSVALGYDTYAKGSSATALGYRTYAEGDNATALGFSTDALGLNSTALGNSTRAIGANSTAMGLDSQARGAVSTAIGEEAETSGDNAVAIGHHATASGNFSLALGYYAQATNLGSFVWMDHVDFITPTSTNANSVTMRASGGYRLFSNAGATAGVFLPNQGTSWASISDRNAKKDFTPVDSREVLEKLAALPITRWHYRWEDASTPLHLGPVAQDFKAAFYPGRDDTAITTQEADGVALAAIQGLNRKVEEENAALRAENVELRNELKSIKALLEKLTAPSH